MVLAFYLLFLCEKTFDLLLVNCRKPSYKCHDFHVAPEI